MTPVVGAELDRKVINDPSKEPPLRSDAQPNPAAGRRLVRSLHLLREQFVSASSSRGQVRWAMVQFIDESEEDVIDALDAACCFGLHAQLPSPLPHGGLVMPQKEDALSGSDLANNPYPKLRWRFVFIGDNASVQVFYEMARRSALLLPECRFVKQGSIPEVYCEAVIRCEWIAWFVLIWCVAWQQPPGTLLDAEMFFKPVGREVDANFFSSAMTLNVFDASIQVIDLLLESEEIDSTQSQSPAPRPGGAEPVASRSGTRQGESAADRESKISAYIRAQLSADVELKSITLHSVHQATGYSTGWISQNSTSWRGLMCRRAQEAASPPTEEALSPVDQLIQEQEADRQSATHRYGSKKARRKRAHE